MNAAAEAPLARAMRRFGGARGSEFGRWFVVAIPYFWLALFFLVPFLIVLKIAFSNVQLSMPPVEPVVTWANEQVLQLRLHFSNFGFVFGDGL